MKNYDALFSDAISLSVDRIYSPDSAVPLVTIDCENYIFRTATLISFKINKK